MRATVCYLILHFIIVLFIILSPVSFSEEKIKQSDILEQIGTCSVKADATRTKKESFYTDEVEILADNFDTKDENIYLISGDARFRYEDLELRSQKIIYESSANSFTLPTGGYLISKGLNVKTDYIFLDGDNKKGKIGKTILSFTDNSSNITADFAEFNLNATSYFHNTTFTSCNVISEKPDWLMRAKTISISHEENTGELHDALLVINDVPALYVPYLTFSIGGRKSGFLHPSLNLSNQTGGYFSTPYYYNIAPESDWTITPYMFFDAGLLLQNEWRSILPGGQFIQQLSVIKDEHNNRNINTPRQRWLNTIRINILEKSSSFGAEFNHSSDNRFIEDFDNLHELGDRNNYRNILSYVERNKYFTLTIASTQSREIDTINEEDSNEYIINSQYPRISFEANNWKIGSSFEFGFRTNYSRLFERGYHEPENPTVKSENLSERTLIDFGFSATPWLSDNAQLELKINSIWRNIDDTIFQQNRSYIAIHHSNISRDGLTLYKFSSAYSQVGVANDERGQVFDFAILPSSYESYFSSFSNSGEERILDSRKFTVGFTSQQYNASKNKGWIRTKFSVQHLERSIALDIKNDTLGLLSTIHLDGENNYTGFTVANRFTGENNYQFLLFGRSSVNELSSLAWYLSFVSDEERGVIDALNQRNLAINYSIGLTNTWALRHSIVHNIKDDQTISSNFSIRYNSCCLSFEIELRRRRTIFDEIDNQIILNFNLINLVERSDDDIFGKIDEWLR